MLFAKTLKTYLHCPLQCSLIVVPDSSALDTMNPIVNFRSDSVAVSPHDNSFAMSTSETVCPDCVFDFDPVVGQRSDITYHMNKVQRDRPQV